MAPRTRLLAFGSAALLVVAGVLCATLFDGVAAEVATISLLLAGLGGALLLIFYEVGLSEDHERARDDEARRRRTEQGARIDHRPWRARRPRRPS